MLALLFVNPLDVNLKVPEGIVSQFWLRFGDREVALPDGELLIGRGEGCHVRLIAPSVSRRHLRMLAVADAVIAFDLDSHNGTWVNGKPVTDPVELHDGDTVLVGSQSFALREAREEPAWDDEPATWDLVMEPAQRAELESRRGHRATLEIDQEALLAIERKSAETITGADGAVFTVGQQLCAVCGKAFDVGQPLCPFCGAEPYSAPKYRTCTGCKALLSEEDAVCPKCSLARSASSMELSIIDDERRDETRHPTAMHGLYVSSALTFEAEVTNISRGGLFIVADLLDPIGTLADIVISIEHHGRARFTGEVAHVIDEPHSAMGGAPGMGLRFVGMQTSARDWLDSFLSDRGSIPPAG